MDFNDGSSTVKITPKQLAIIVGGVVVAVVIIVFVIRFLQGDQTQSFKPSVKDQKASIEKTCEGSQDKTVCIATLSGQAAAQSGQVELCKELKPEEYDGCVWEAADAKNDASLCASIVNNENRQLCSDTIYLTQAFESKNSDLCDKIENQDKRDGCKRVAPGPITVENCVLRGQDSVYCEMLQAAREANQKQDPRVCEKLKGDRILDCKDRVGKNDPDFDGLTTLEETRYKSDPDKSDTDGDGYKDGDEVAAGYNPNGPGKIE
jgi:hypothetical protein